MQPPAGPLLKVMVVHMRLREGYMRSEDEPVLLHTVYDAATCKCKAAGASVWRLAHTHPWAGAQQQLHAERQLQAGTPAAHPS